MSASPSPPQSLGWWRRGLAGAGALDRMVMPFVAVLLLVRVLTDNLSAPGSRQSGSVNLSGVIAVLFVLAAAVLLLRNRRAVLLSLLAGLWICIWTAIAVGTKGASSETVREGVRELSVIALAVIVCNLRGSLSAPAAARLIQGVGLVPAVVALYQLPSRTGMEVAGHLRSNGTFAHPNSAVMFFAIALAASLWRYLGHGRSRADLALAAVFAAAIITTFSIDGLLTAFVMMAAAGALQPGSWRVKAVPWAVGLVIVAVFFATPLGAARVARESNTNLAAEQGESDTSLEWRLKKWKALLPEWEKSPVVGRGLGITTTTQGTPANPFGGFPPHNEYVRYLVETGVLGCLILLSALWLLVRALIRRRTDIAASGSAFNASTLAIVVLIGCLVNSLADNTLLNTPTAYAAALILASVLALPRSERAAPTARVA
ncbi:MAG TPA: O-antigen ligase family protein [Solirubrobacteraceae bacterium]|nr:O-antigen ligase family protein [Solirubrobacteraceae bacterium]